MRRLLTGRSKIEFPPPWWKVKREINRVLWQIDDISFKYFGISWVLLYFKHVISRRIKTHNGALTLGPRAALYIIFPSDGLQRSHLASLTYIADCGYTPIVVSNLPLTSVDIGKLTAMSAAVIIRPNIGYDFGAYRDGIFYLKSTLPKLDYLAILNDSTWFPVNPLQNWFADAEALGRDFVGSASHYGMDPYRDWDFRVNPWEFDPHYPTFHYGSYSLLVSKNLLKSKKFLTYWKNYRPSSDKKRTINGGEMGLSRMIVDNGFTHSALLDNTHFDVDLSQMPAPELRDIALHMITPLMKKSDALDPAESDPETLRSFILLCLARYNPGYSLVSYDVKYRHGNFIKKSPVTIDLDSANKTLKLLGELSSRQAAIYLDEASRAYRKAYGADYPAGKTQD